MSLRALLIITSGLILLTGGCNSESSQKISQKHTRRQDILEVVSVEPESPQELALGQRLQVHIGYQLNTAETAYIWARPYRNGNKVGGYGAHHLIPVSKKRDFLNADIADSAGTGRVGFWKRDVGRSPRPSASQ